MDIIIQIPEERVHELIEEAGSRYWARDLVWLDDRQRFTLVEHGGIHDKGSPGETTHSVTMDMVRDGLTKMANAEHDKGGHHFAAVRDWRQSDMYTGDAVIQFAIFGELKYS